MWSSSTSGYCACDLGDDVLPELEGLEHVGLVDAGHALAALARRLEGDVRDALDLGPRVAHRVERLLGAREVRRRARAAAARLAEVDVAGELADDQDVEARRRARASGSTRAASCSDSRSPGGSWRTGPGACAGRGSPARGAARARACRTSSRRRRRTAPRRPPCASFERRFGQRMAVRLVGGAADQRRLRSRTAGRARAAPARASRDDLGADAVAGQDCDLHESLCERREVRRQLVRQPRLARPGARPRRRGSCRRGAASGRCRRSR